MSRLHTRRTFSCSSVLSALVVPALFISVLAGLTGCGEPDEFELPSTVDTIIDQERLGEMNDMGLSVHDGFSPPDVSGTYAWDDTTWVVAPRTENVGKAACDGELTLDREHTTAYSYQRQYGGENCAGSGSGSSIPMSGRDNCFSLYLRTTKTESGCVSGQVEVISGCLADDGIEDFETGWFVESYQSEECDALVSSGRLPPEGQTVILREGDGLAERQ